MTPRTKESEKESSILQKFSQTLLQESQKAYAGSDLTINGPLWDTIHPAILKTKILFEEFPEELNYTNQSRGWYLECYPDAKQAGLKIEKFVPGRPFEIWKFLQQPQPEIAFDFGPMGVVCLSSQQTAEPQQKELCHYLLPVWLDYALSPELWGAEGKWTRFHESLNTLFKGYDLLKGHDFPGFYPLKDEAQRIEKHGFRGSRMDSTYTLTMPWTFSLNQLRALEEAVRQEF